MIPAHPLALTAKGRLDERAQIGVSRYQLDAGAHGLAVGVHSTQFELHDDPGMLRTVWQSAAEIASARADQPLLIAGLVGDTEQAVREAEDCPGSRLRSSADEPLGHERAH